MSDLLERYATVAGEEVVNQLRQLANPLKGLKVVHINSTKEGGGVAEILNKLVPLMQALDLDVSWEVITGEEDFYKCTKGFHNALQGQQVVLSDRLLSVYEETNALTAEKMRPMLQDADIVIIHDPQPAPLLKFIEKRTGKWIWRCHIDLSRPNRRVWSYIKQWVEQYDASIFSLPDFARTLPHPQYLILPSIDPLAEKNIDLPPLEVKSVMQQFKLDPDRPVILQVSRFDRFKDPVGVIAAYRLAKKAIPLQLVLAGGRASDDPEGAVVLEEVRNAADGDPDIHILELPADAHRTINALQRGADIVLQKSIREGFGLTVTEALWKEKPVVGGDTGGIRLQVINHYTGFLVKTPEGAALRIRYLLHDRDKMREMGKRARRLVKENFLLTRHLKEYLSVMLSAIIGREGERLEVWSWK